MIAGPLLVVSSVLVALSAPQSVEIVVVGTASDLQRVRELVDPSRLGGAPPRWRRADRFDPTEVLRAATTLRCWVDLSDRQRSRVRVTFAARSGERFLVRDLELSRQFDELDGQALAQVLELSVTALLEDEHAGLNREQTEALLLPSTPTPQPTLVSPPTTTAPLVAARSWHPGIFYGAMALGPRLPIAHGPGLWLEWTGPAGRGVGTGKPIGLSGWIDAQARLPIEPEANGIALQLFAVAARAGVALAWPPPRTKGAGGTRPGEFQFEGLVSRWGFGVDLVRSSPRATSPDGSVLAAPQRWSESLVISAALGLRACWGALSAIELRVVADILPTAVHYDLSAAAQIQPVFSPWRLRPGLALALNL